MLLDQPDQIPTRIEVMLDETILIVKTPSPDTKIFSQDIRGMSYKEIGKEMPTRPLKGVTMKRKAQ